MNKNLKSKLFLIAGFLLLKFSLTAQGQTFPIFGDELANSAEWRTTDGSRGGGYSEDSEKYIYVGDNDSPLDIVNLSIPIRENPRPGEYRYITFAWIKWGGEQIGLKLLHDPNQRTNNKGIRNDYTYYAGRGDSIKTGIMVDEQVRGNWVVQTRDLWNDFGDFTLTGVSLLCPMRRDAGFDAIILGQNQDAFASAPAVLPNQIAESIELDDDGNMILEGYFGVEDDEYVSDGVDIDWAGQIRAGGIWMYPLYILALAGILIGVQRTIASRGGKLAPKKLRNEVGQCLANNDIDGALVACKKYPSTLAKSLSYIFEHINAGRKVVSQIAGDIAVRDIRIHLSKIYPLSVISSLSPLLGLLGTIVGMIEAFGLVALYGDEGGSAILSDSISKALITTAAGLIIAVPAITGYFIIRNRIMRLASLIEVEIERTITSIYIKEEHENKSDKQND